MEEVMGDRREGEFGSGGISFEVEDDAVGFNDPSESPNTLSSDRPIHLRSNDSGDVGESENSTDTDCNVPFLNTTRSRNDDFPTEGYDPKRIPASVFVTKATNAADWSVASNESLFSIQIGNSSFSRDHFFALYKSGELPQDPLSVTSKLQTVMEAENAGRDSPIFKSSVEEHGHNGTIRQSSVSSSTSSENHDRNSGSSAVSFQYLLTDADKGPSININMDKLSPQKPMTMIPEQPESPMKPQNTARYRLFSWLSCRSPTCCFHAN